MNFGRGFKFSKEIQNRPGEFDEKLSLHRCLMEIPRLQLFKGTTIYAAGPGPSFVNLSFLRLLIEIPFPNGLIKGR